MADADDVYVGRTLLESGRITRDELVECLFDLAVERRAAGTPVRPLGVLLVARGRITRPQLNALLAKRVSLVDPRLRDATAPALGELLIAAGAATRDQVAECLLLQNDDSAKRLGELLVENGYSTVAQIERALAYHDKSVHECRDCHARFNIVGATPGDAHCCEKCGGALEAAPSGSLDATDTATHERLAPAAPDARPAPAATDGVPELAPEAQVQLDRAAYVYIKQKLTVRRELLREAERLQTELSRYGVWLPFLDILQKLGGLTWIQAEQVRKSGLGELVSTKSWKQQAIPGYRVVHKIASGSFATIFSADPVFGGKRVAVKVLHADRVGEADTVARFRSEAALMMRLRHPGIVAGYDLSEHGGVHYISMELIEGDSLDRVVHEGRGLNAIRSIDVMRQVAAALAHLHEEGFVHRDVKPANILSTPDGIAKLCDLGFASPIRATDTGSDGNHGVVTDIYSLGVTLFYMLTAHARFEGPASSEVLAARFVSGGQEVDLSTLRAPPPVLALLRRMVHVDRSKRFQTYEHLTGAIDACWNALRPNA